MKVWEATLEILRETDNAAVMYGDTVLLHKIAVRAGLKYRTNVNPFRAHGAMNKKVLDALSHNPGPLVPGFTLVGVAKRVRIFRVEGK